MQISNMGMPLSWSLVDPVVAQDARFKVKSLLDAVH